MPRYSVIRNVQSLDSRSQYQFSHIQIDTSLEVTLATLFRGGAKSRPRSAFHSTIIAQSRLVLTKRVKTCQRLIINEREIVSLISICILTRHHHSEITVYLYQIMSTHESQMRSSVEQSSKGPGIKLNV